MAKPILIDRTEPEMLQALVAGYVAEGFTEEDALVVAEVTIKTLKGNSIKFQRSGHAGYRINAGGAI